MNIRPIPLSGPPRVGRTAVVFVLGLLLVANGAYLYPQNAPSDRTTVYEARSVGDPDPGTLPDEATDSIVDCNYVAVESQACAVVRRIRSDGPLRVETDADLGPTFTDYEFVAADGEVFRPDPRVENDTLVLDLSPAAPDAVRRSLATDYGEAAEPVRTAVAEGRVRTAATVPSDQRFVSRNGTYYVVERVRSFEESTRWGLSAPPAEQVFLLRVGGWVGGLALVWWAGRRAP